MNRYNLPPSKRSRERDLREVEELKRKIRAILNRDAYTPDGYGKPDVLVEISKLVSK